MGQRFFALDRRKIQDGKIRVRLGAFRPRFVKGDAILSYKRNAEDIIFTEQMIAEAVKEQEEKDGNFQTTSVGKPVGLDGGRRLAVLAGSLQKVYRFLHPERHFRQGFARLTQDDYETIIHNAADVERSVFRYLFSALPFQVQTDFVSSHFGEDIITSDGHVKDYALLSKELLRYFKTRVETFVFLLTACEKTFSEMKGVKNLPSINRLVIQNPEDREAFEIGRLAREFRGLAENSLFSEKPGVPPLLAEALAQLSEDR